ncbi:MAG: type III pantothenate kinase [Rhodanobacteraceae bacterium]|jgi:type III pantothenate kinase|nr:type III pantothenate kinase [Rhodanobacteraceae bacterium]
MNLLIDFGNTRLKWALLDGTRLQPRGVFAHVGKVLATELRREWIDLAHPRHVWVASVASDAREHELALFVRERFGVRTEFVRSPAAALGVRNAYAEPARLGVDRFLALVALHAAQSRAQVLASVGTALTLDALAADGAHLGGVIVPSPALMRQAVLGGTARVGAGDGHWRDLPCNTADAVYTGSLYAAAGAIDRFHMAAARHLGSTPALVLTGGGGGDLAPLLPQAEPAHDLVLHGLARWAMNAAGADG